MSELPICACPRPTQRIEESLDGLKYLPQTPDVIAHRDWLMRQLDLAMAGRMAAAVHDRPLVCIVCRGVQS
jgi:hypothetical protein